MKPSLASLCLALCLPACDGGALTGSATDPNTIDDLLSRHVCEEPRPDGLQPLGCVAIARPQGDIVDRRAAIRLGKALFWDVQVSSDGLVACATCHFSAGIDTRRHNTLNPGPNNVFESGGVTAAGQDFDGSALVTDDRVGSQGVVGGIFTSVSDDPRQAADLCAPDLSPPFDSERRVTGRNAPSVIGAIFNRENFWDGRANHAFNGFDPFGATGNAEHPAALFEGGSLSSQAVGPPLSSTEMSCAGRLFNGPGSIGTKLLTRQPLAFQYVSRFDSRLGLHSALPGRGLRCGYGRCTYRELVAEAFGPELAADAENQFSRLFGQALQAYMSTLIPSRTPLDRYLGGHTHALTSRQIQGLQLFTGKANCTECHKGAELSDASISFIDANGTINDDGGDQGFHNTGVRPTEEDLGRAALGPNGVSFSVSGSDGDRGAFKTPGLRNAKLSAPYFHNGGKATLAEVVDFYDRGGDFDNPEKDPQLVPLMLSDDEKAALVDFLENALTDCRVEKERAPFDHPSLDVPNGPHVPAVGAFGLGFCW